MKSNNKGFGVIATLLVLAGILIVGGGTYYIGKGSKTTPPVSVKENNLVEEDQNDVTNQTKILSYKTPCEISSISKQVFSFSYPDGFSIKETKPLERNVPGGGIMNTELKPKDNSESISIKFPFESCEYTGYKLCKGVGNGYVIVTNNSNPNVVSAYNKILSTIKLNESTECEQGSNTCKPDDTPWIKVISPNGGETFKVGEKIIVKWESCNISKNERITSRINSVKISKIGNGYSTTKDRDPELGLNNGEAELIIPEEIYTYANSHYITLPIEEFSPVNLFIFAPDVLIWPKTTCLDGSNCMPGPSNPQSQTDSPFNILPNIKKDINLLRKIGETCGEKLGTCEAGLVCIYPCGIPGCKNECMPENTPPIP
jgi:hypothetical protein